MPSIMVGKGNPKDRKYGPFSLYSIFIISWTRSSKNIQVGDLLLKTVIICFHQADAGPLLESSILATQFSNSVLS